MINALLDYEQIAPSSGLGGACTAIATEFRYREDGDKMFKAIIQYITHEEFMVEAEILANDLLAEEEISGMAEDDGKDQPKDPDTPADIAWSKISALFPDLKRGELVTGKNGQKHESVNPILESLKERALRIKEFGATDEIQTDDEEEFGQKVSFYVSSAVEDDDKSDDGLSIEDVDSDNNEVVNLEQGNVTASEKDCVNTAANNTNRSCIWPFVKAFKVYLEADILKAGVVLIDLPGQGDSNPARAKVADSYMQRVEGLCIALEAKRASDNNNGDKLLRQRIKQGLKMQGLGSVSSMCLVCTKTDVRSPIPYILGPKSN